MPCYIQTIIFGYLALNIIWPNNSFPSFSTAWQIAFHILRYFFWWLRYTLYIGKKILIVLKEKYRLKEQSESMIFVVIYELYFYEYNIAHCIRSRDEHAIIFVSRHSKFHDKGIYVAEYKEDKVFGETNIWDLWKGWSFLVRLKEHIAHVSGEVEFGC